jgi:translation initiation factor 5A
MATKASTLKSLKPGNYVMIDDEPCKVISITLSKPGKHGSAKARLDAVGIFDDKKRGIMKPADAAVQVPIIEKKKAQVISISGDFIQLMDLEDYSIFDASLPADMKGKFETGAEIGYWKLENKILLKEG